MNPTRPDVISGINQVDLSVPLSQQNAHQRVDTPMVPHGKRQAKTPQEKTHAQTILEQSGNVKVPLSQKNAHQNFEQNSARSDVNGRAAESQRQPIYTHVQPILEQSGNVKVPLSQKNAHQNFEQNSASSNVNSRAAESQRQPIFTHVQPILQQSDKVKVPLSQKNAHQNFEQTFARSDVNAREAESRQPIGTAPIRLQQYDLQEGVFVPVKSNSPPVVQQPPQSYPHQGNVRSSTHYPVQRVPGEAPSLLSLFLAVVFVCAAVALSIFASAFSSRRQ